MQPYFLPYIGYFQLIGAVDLFIIYDNIKYTKKGWINRNRLLQNGRDVVFSLPLKSGSDYLDVRDRELAPSFDRNRLVNQIGAAYRRAPYFPQTAPLVESIVRHDERNLFRFLHNSLVETCRHLEIATEIKVSSEVPIDHRLRNQQKVLALCEAVGARTYINAFGGTELYAAGEFRGRGIELKFIRPGPFTYQQFGDCFVPWLSIVDVMMFNAPDVISKCIRSNYNLF